MTYESANVQPVNALEIFTGVEDEPDRLTVRDRVKNVIGRFAAATGIVVLGTGVLAPAEAGADEPTCYGDYCSGQYADVTNCDEDATTLTSSKVTVAKLSGEIGVIPPGAAVGTGDQEEVGELELRYSDKCGTVWGRLELWAGSSVHANGVRTVGAHQEGGYKQVREIQGNFNGAPPGEFFSPQIYGRGREHRAFVDIKEMGVTSQEGTEWVRIRP